MAFTVLAAALMMGIVVPRFFTSMADAIARDFPRTRVIKVETPPLIERQPRVCLNMIVKNEAHTIEAALGSALPVISSLVIVDTGSTDNTIEVIQAFLARHSNSVSGTVLSRPWVNFGHNREEALQLAQRHRDSKNNQADWILFLDADDRLVRHAAVWWPADWESYDSFSLKIIYSQTVYYRPQLVRPRADCHWHDALHEYVACNAAPRTTTLTTLSMECTSSGARSQDPDKFQKDVTLLEELVAANPSHERYVFYLAQSYRNAGNFEKAIEMYTKRAAMGGWIEEMYYSKFKTAELYELLHRSQHDIVGAYMDAHLTNTQRAEPLHALARWFRHQQFYELGYAIAQVGVHRIGHSQGPPGVLFADRSVYEYQMLEEFAICAAWLDKFPEALGAYDRILANPYITDPAEKQRIQNSRDVTLQRREFMSQPNNQNH